MENLIAMKRANINGRWQTVTLTDEELSEALGDLLEFNISELKRIIILTKESAIMAITQVDAIKILFERQGISSFTYLNNVLEDKIDRLRSGEKKPEPRMVAEPTEEEITDKDNPFEAGKVSTEYEEIKLPKEKKKGFF
jgi:hypothetical protein